MFYQPEQEQNHLIRTPNGYTLLWNIHIKCTLKIWCIRISRVNWTIKVFYNVTNFIHNLWLPRTPSTSECHDIYSIYAISTNAAIASRTNYVIPTGETFRVSKWNFKNIIQTNYSRSYSRIFVPFSCKTTTNDNVYQNLPERIVIVILSIRLSTGFGFSFFYLPMGIRLRGQLN